MSTFTTPPPEQPGPVTAPGTNNKDIMAIAALVLGVINLCAWFIPLCGLPLSIVGLVLGFLGMNAPTRRTLAIIGLVLCGLGLLASIGNAALGAYLGLTGGFKLPSP